MMKPKVFKKIDSFFYLYTALMLLLILCFWMLNKIDTINMINNGFVSNEAIVFVSDDPHFNINNIKGSYLLFQMNKPENLTYIYRRGDLLLPNFSSDVLKIHKISNETAIIGERVPKNIVPDPYKIGGYFRIAGSYRLMNAIWLFTSNESYDMKQGKYFIFQSPNKKTRAAFVSSLNKQSIPIINQPQVGTYVSKANQFLVLFLHVTVVLLSFLLLVSITIRAFAERVKLHILYLWGTSFSKMYRLNVQSLLLIQLLCLPSLVGITYYISLIYGQLWSNDWVHLVLDIGVLFMIYTLFISLVVVYTYTIKKGGKKL